MQGEREDPTQRVIVWDEPDPSERMNVDVLRRIIYVASHQRQTILPYADRIPPINPDDFVPRRQRGGMVMNMDEAA